MNSGLLFLALGFNSAARLWRAAGDTNIRVHLCSSVVNENLRDSSCTSWLEILRFAGINQHRDTKGRYKNAGKLRTT